MQISVVEFSFSYDKHSWVFSEASVEFIKTIFIRTRLAASIMSNDDIMFEAHGANSLPFSCGECVRGCFVSVPNLGKSKAERVKLRN